MNKIKNGVRVAIVGTFDVQNYGDLLFPLIAAHELNTRLKHVEVVPFSYHAIRGKTSAFYAAGFCKLLNAGSDGIACPAA